MVFRDFGFNRHYLGDHMAEIVPCAGGMLLAAGGGTRLHRGQHRNPKATRGKEVPKGAVLRLLSRKTMWGIFLTQGCCIYTIYLYLTWLPSYLVKARGMELMKASLFNAIPYLIAVVLGIYFGQAERQDLNAPSAEARQAAHAVDCLHAALELRFCWLR